MKKNALKSLLATALAVCTVMGSTATCFAAETQEVSGSTAQSKDVKVTAEIQSVYSVSLPATLELEYQTISQNGNNYDGYWTKLKYGVSGKISASEKVYVKPTYPCELSIIEDGQAQASINVWDIAHCDNYGQTGNGVCKTEWGSSEIGSCDYDGATISNCNYSYCCSDGHWIGVKSSDITEYGSYEGNLTFQFGIE